MQSKAMLPSPPVSASMGTLSITWCLDDPYIIFPAEGVPPRNDAELSDDVMLKASNLLAFCGPEGSEGPTNPLNKDVSSTRGCIINFAVPAVQVIDAPFDIDVSAPSSFAVGDTYTLHLLLVICI